MIVQLKVAFQALASQERQETLTRFINQRMVEGSSVKAHVLKMKSYIEQLDRLGFPFPSEFAIDVIIGSLSKTFN